MMERKRAEVHIYNEPSLQELAWRLKASQGQLFLILAHCNYSDLRWEMVQRLKEICPLEIREFTLPVSVTKVYTAIQKQLKQNQPVALMVFGLEAVINLDEALKALNQIREEFRKNFHFPIVLWVTDEVLVKLRQLAPDFWSWTVTTEFSLPTELLIEEVHQRGDVFFTKIAEAGAEPLLLNETIFEAAYRQESKAALRELKSREQTLKEVDSSIQACVDFVLGREHYFKNEVENALEHYRQSLYFWQQTHQLERQGVLLHHIGLCYRHQAEVKRDETQRKENWQKARRFFQESLDAFEQAERQDLVAKFITSLEEALLNLEEWSQLEEVTLNFLKKHQNSNYLFQLARNYGFIAEIALEQSHPEKAKQVAQQALNIVTQLPEVHRWHQDYYLFLLARSQYQQDQISEAIATLEQAITLAPENNPSLHSSIWGLLSSLYYQQKDYLRAFEIKQKRLSIEQQFGLRAFIGAGRLKPQRYTVTTLSQSEVVSTVAQEIAASGRQQDVKHLIDRISNTQHKLTVIYGPSGVGKSSLVAAGLVPALQQKKVIGSRDIFPILLEVYTDWSTELGKRLSAGLSQIDNTHDPNTEYLTLNAILTKLQQNSNKNLLTVLIFDQFEEFFFVYSEPDERNQFADFFYKCLNLDYVKIVFSIREDQLHFLLYFARLKNLEAIGNGILNSDILFYVGNFALDAAKSVIERLTERSHFYLDADLVEELVNNLMEQGEVRPIELQIIGAELQEENVRTLEQYKNLGDNPKEILVQKYLEEVVKDCGSENQHAAELILYLLTDQKNNRPLKTKADLERDLIALPALVISKVVALRELELILKILVGSGSVSEFKLPQEQDLRYQIAHDYLAEIVNRNYGNNLIKNAQEKAIFFQKGLLDALSDYAEELYKNNKRFDALIAALKAGIQMQKQNLDKQCSGRLESDNPKVLLALLNAIYGTKIINRTKDRTPLEECNRLEGHRDHVISLAFSPDGTLIASGSRDRTIKLWNTDGACLITLPREDNEKDEREDNEEDEEFGHTSSVESVAFSPDSMMIVSGDRDGTIKLWRRDGTLLNTLYKVHDRAVESVVFSPDGTMIASASSDHIIRIWQKDGNPLTTLEGHSKEVIGVAFSPDSQLIASASRDRTIKLWHKCGNLIRTFEGHEYAVYGLAFSPDGQLIASTSWDRTIKIWKIENGALIHNLKGHESPVYRAAFSPDGKIIVSTSWDRTIRLWNTEDGTLLQTFKGHEEPIEALAISHDGSMIGSGSRDKMIKLWNWLPSNLLTMLKHDLAVQQVAFSPDGKMIASASRDRTIKLWQRDGTLQNILGNHRQSVMGVAFSPNGQLIASASRDSTVNLWKTDGTLVNTFRGHNSDVYGVAFSSDCQLIASASGDKTVKIWNKNCDLLTELKGHKNEVTSVAFSPDSQLIVSASRDGTIKLWKINGTLVDTLHERGHSYIVNAVTFSPDGLLIASGNSDNTIMLWTKDGRLKHRLIDHSGSVTAVAFSPDSQIIASASSDRTIKLWATNGSLIGTLKGHQDWVESVQFSPNGKILASASQDKTVILWNLDLDDLLVRGCNLVRNFLEKNPNVSESDRHLCEEINLLI